MGLKSPLQGPGSFKPPVQRHLKGSDSPADSSWSIFPQLMWQVWMTAEKHDQQVKAGCEQCLGLLLGTQGANTKCQEYWLTSSFWISFPLFLNTPGWFSFGSNFEPLMMQYLRVQLQVLTLNAWLWASSWGGYSLSTTLVTSSIEKVIRVIKVMIQPDHTPPPGGATCW